MWKALVLNCNTTDKQASKQRTIIEVHRGKGDEGDKVVVAVHAKVTIRMLNNHTAWAIISKNGCRLQATGVSVPGCVS
jgi:hypothetical protein